MPRLNDSAGAMQNFKLRQCILALVPKISKDKDRHIGEENTKTTLIEPVLDALGWNVRDWEEVHREFRSKPGDNPVDYALKTMGTPRLFVEAKGLGENLDERKWAAQVVSYAATAGVTWCALTDGDEWRFYNSTAPVDAEKKEFFRVRLSETSVDHAISALAPVSRGNLDGKVLEERWAIHFVDRRVKEALDTSLNPPEKELVDLVSRKVPELDPNDIAASFARLDIRISLGTKPSSVHVPTDGVTLPPELPPEADVTLADLIGAGILKSGAKLSAKYMGQILEATLLADGGVEFQGTRFDTCGGAAVAAKKAVTGEEKSTNGWDFWKVEGEGGRHRTLGEVRDAYQQR